MIQVEKIIKKFEDFTAVDAIDLDISQGEVMALLGPNGAGKTTTVRMLTSVLIPSGGKASVAGYDVVREPEMVRASVGVLTEDHGLYNRMPAEEYLDFFGQLYRIDKDDRKKRIVNLFSRFDLENVKKRRIGEFSKGMRQKLALARSLLHDPEVLLLDEPTSAMDPESARLVRNMIKKMSSDKRTVLICTHNLSEAEELADRIAIINKGKIIEKGTPNYLKEKLLGASRFEIKFQTMIQQQDIDLNDLVDQLEFGPDWIRYSCSLPQAINPTLIKKLTEMGLGIIYAKELPRSLESIYLKAVMNNGEDHAV
jgi:ABC-2 type transport system ATP-binding protein